MFLNNTACNLASLNLMKFKRDDGTFDVERFKAAVRNLHHRAGNHRGQRQLPDQGNRGEQPSVPPAGPRLRQPRLAHHELGLPYDSDEGRALAGAITAIMTGHAYNAARRAWPSGIGAFEGFATKPRSRCLQRHRAAPRRRETHPPQVAPIYLRDAAQRCGDEAVELGRRYGYRNAQVTVLAPTGTIAFLMDCDTTGVEPDIALVKYKLLAGGGMLKIVNRTVPMALRKLRLRASSRSPTS